VYFISPQIWAWGKNRIKVIKKCVKKIVVFFRFEEELYRSNGIDVAFIGHPLVEVARSSFTKNQARAHYGVRTKKVVALLPGSRKNEVARLLSVMIKASSLIRSSVHDVEFLISKHDNVDRKIYETALKECDIPVHLVEGKSYDMIKAADFAIAVSGTVTLECAVIGTPMVIIYKGNMISWGLFKLVSRIPNIGLVNIVAGKRIMPELLQNNATPEKIASLSLDLLNDERKMASSLRELAEVKDSLGAPGAYQRAAEAVCAALNT